MMSMNATTVMAADASHEDGFMAIAREVAMIAACLIAFVVSRFVVSPAKPKRRKTPPPGDRNDRPDDRTRPWPSAVPRLESRERGASVPPLTPVRPAGMPQARATEQQLIRLLEQREFTRALNIYRAAERDGRDGMFTSEAMFSSFIQSAIRVGKVDVIERLLVTMHRNGLQPSLTFWQTSLKMLSSRKHFSTVVSAYEVFASNLPTDKVTFSCLINGALECNKLDAAAAMLDQYGQSGLDSKDYVLHFRTYAASALPGPAIDLLTRMLQKGTATTLMVNLALLACVTAKEVHRAAQVLQLAHESEAANSRIVDVVSYNTIMKGFAQEGRAGECLQHMDRMREHGIEPDDVTLGYVVEVCANNDNDSIARTIREVGARRGTEADNYGLFLRGLVRGGHIVKAMDLFNSMQSSGIVLDFAIYSLLVKAAVDSHDLDNALVVVQRLRDAGYEIDDVILTHLVEGCRHAGNRDLGSELFDTALGAGVKPSEYTLIAMLKLFGRCGAHAEAHDMVERCEREYGFKPSVIHYTCLMSGCLRGKNHDQAWAAFELMQRRGVCLDQMALSTLLPGLVAAESWDLVLQLAEVAAKLRLPLPTEATATAIRQLGASPLAERLAKLSRR